MHSFKDKLRPLRSCSIETLKLQQLFLRCHFCNENRTILINDLENIDQSLPTLSEMNLVDLLLYAEAAIQMCS